jgi:hypothetical protein
MVGIEVAREAARELKPDEIIISALTAGEVDEAIRELEANARDAGWKVKFTAAPGDIFLPAALQGHPRNEIAANKEWFDVLFDDIFASSAQTYKSSALYKMVETFQPDVVVDCINTATAISYQDSFTVSKRVKVMLDRIEKDGGFGEVPLDTFVREVRDLVIAQGVPQIARHILLLHQTLSSTRVRIYVKVGTTGTGGMGINIPYTHSEDKPSPTLLSKSAIGFAHTGLLFLLARTPGLMGENGEENLATLVKEIKPGAMIGFRRLGSSHVKLAGPTGRREPAYLLDPKVETLGAEVQPRASYDGFGRFEGRDVPVNIVGADTGENGFFCIGEFQAITYPRQMEFVTPEEVARTAILEILGSSTGRDVLAAIDGAITEPSYRAGILRDHACRELDAIEGALSSGRDFLPSVAIGQLGPPRLSKLLFEAYLIRAALGTSIIGEIAAQEPEDIRRAIEEYLEANPRVSSLITTVGIPILRSAGGKLTIARGPKMNIPVPRPDGRPNELTPEKIERNAFLGWVDLRVENFELWRERVEKLGNSRADIAESGSSAFDRASYMPDTFVPGDVVGWLLANEADESGWVGHRMF